MPHLARAIKLHRRINAIEKKRIRPPVRTVLAGPQHKPHFPRRDFVDPVIHPASPSLLDQVRTKRKSPRHDYNNDQKSNE
jgi:hypothetical protein